MQNFKNDHYVEFLITFLNYSNYELSTLNTASLQRCLPIASAGIYI
ncbi:hypothetical protein CM318V1_350001 [Carnobacterium maltaromaticum]|nr:hypothetical protein CM318V1_350001 [Carnobacterium maltaromaticum]